MKVLVTGGSGKAGRFVVRDLVEAGHDVVNLDRVRLPDLPGKQIIIDLSDAGAVYDAFAQVQPEGVCHLAANPSPSGFSRQSTFVGNITITYNVMQAAGDNGVRRFISAGSEMATGWLTTEQLPPRFPFNENDRLDSPNAYALSKYLVEPMADSMVTRYSEISICTLRINNVIPPEDAIAMLQPRRDEFPGPGSANFWSYIDARDVGGSFTAALQGDSTGHEVYLIAAADTCIEVPIRDAVKRRYGKEGNFSAEHGDFESVFDCSKMREHFGWVPKHSWRD